MNEVAIIEKCREFLSGFMYAPGLLEFGSDQHRDLVRTFFAGALEALMLTGQKDAIQSLRQIYGEMVRETWLPDERFNDSRLA